AVKTASDKPNVGITGVTSARSTSSNQERVTVTAGLINRSERPVAATTVKLQVGGIPVGSKQLALEPSGSAAVSFDPVTVSSRNPRGTVTISEDGLGADNAYNFTLTPSQPLKV